MKEQTRGVLTLDVPVLWVSLFSKCLLSSGSSWLVERVVCSPWVLFLIFHCFFGSLLFGFTMSPKLFHLVKLYFTSPSDLWCTLVNSSFLKHLHWLTWLYIYMNETIYDYIWPYIYVYIICIHMYTHSFLFPKCLRQFLTHS